MRLARLVVVALVSASCFTVQGFAAEAPASQPTFGRPLIPDMIADPSVVQFGDTFYCYATTDGYPGGISRSGPAVVWTSKDFVDWSFDGSIFPEADGAPYWAPSSVIERGGTYFLYPTLGASIYCATAKSPLGPFHNANGVDVFKGAQRVKPLVEDKGPRGTKGIDAEVLIDDDGSATMVFAQRGIARMSDDLKSFAGDVSLVETKRHGYSEGPFLFKRKGVYYYLYTLGGHEAYQYAYMMSRTGPMGPWTAPERDIIATTDHAAGVFGPGHGCVFMPKGSDDAYFIYLEYSRGGATRQVWADRVTFNADGTIEPITLTKRGVGALAPLMTPGVNLALGATATASSVRADGKVKPIKDPTIDRVETFAPANATDESNGSRWMAADGDAAPTFTLDLGATKTIHQTAAYFVMPTAGHAYRIESSTDGTTWQPFGGHDDVQMKSPHVDVKNADARYLKLTILRGAAGLWEFKAY